MIDIGWMEMLVVAVVALLVIGPKDLPRALRTVGHWVGKVKGVAREFQSSVDDMIRESDLEEYRQGIQNLADGELDDDWDRKIDPTGSENDPFAGPTGDENDPFVEPAPPTAPPARDLLNSEVEAESEGLEVAQTEGVAEAEIAGEHPSADPESARTGT